MLSTILTVATTASASSLAFYWGQNSAGTEQPLASYCKNTPGDVFIISFINQFGNGKQMGMNIHGYYNFIPGTQLLDAKGLGDDITTCQQLGKKVLISLGGAVGDYGLANAADAENVATDLWNYFGGGSSSTRPFGQDVKVDGFDLDAENGVGAAEYATLAQKLNEYYGSDSSKQYYLSASPQCVYPDATLDSAISAAKFDYIFVQFYNNYCALSGSSFNFDTWQNFASTRSPNKNVQIFASLAGSPTAGSGYATIEQIADKYPELKNSANFGGFAAWDASQVNSNIVDGVSFAERLEELLEPAVTEPSSTETTSFAPATSAITTSTASQVPVSATATDASESSSSSSSSSSASTIPVVSDSVSTSSSAVIASGSSFAPNSTWVNPWAPSWTTVVKTYTDVLPCTTTSTPVTGGSPVVSVGVTTVVHTLTTTEPCTTSSVSTPEANAYGASPSSLENTAFTNAKGESSPSTETSSSGVSNEALSSTASAAVASTSSAPSVAGSSAETAKVESSPSSGVASKALSTTSAAAATSSAPAVAGPSVEASSSVSGPLLSNGATTTKIGALVVTIALAAMMF